MFLRSNRRFKNSEEHRYWNIVENRRCASGKVVQRQVLYLGEIDDDQHDDWSRAIEVFDEDARRHTQLHAYCLHVTLRARLKPLAPGLTSRAVLDKMAAVQMLDVHFPTTDGRTLILSRHTELNADQKLLLKQLKLDLPPQPPPRITSSKRSARPQLPVL
jgi:hypothetical protein